MTKQERTFTPEFKPEAERVIMCSRVTELFTQSRSAVSSRSIMQMMKDGTVQLSATASAQRRPSA